MPVISRISTPSGEYEIKDAVAREMAAGTIKIKGATSTALTDEATTNPIVIDGENHTAVANEAVFYNKKEFVFDGTKWHEFGDMSGLGSLATKNSGSVTIQPKGTVTATFSGDTSAVTITAVANDSGNYQPAGTLTEPTFTGTSSTFTGSFAPAGTVTVSTNTTENKTTTVSAGTGTETYTPSGSVSTPNFTGTQTTITSSATYTPGGSVSLSNQNVTATVSVVSTGDKTYTPSGTVGAPTISVATAGTTTSIKNPTAKTVITGVSTSTTEPANNLAYVTVGSNETLIFRYIGYTSGDSITTSNVTVKTGDASYTASTAAFTGTGVRLVTGNIAVPYTATFSGSETTISSSANYQPEGTIGAISFTGNGVHLVTGNIAVPKTYTAAFTASSQTVTVSGTPNGTVSAPTFTGTKVQLSGSVVPEGTVSSTFTGTQETVSVDFT